MFPVRDEEVDGDGWPIVSGVYPGSWMRTCSSVDGNDGWGRLDGDRFPDTNAHVHGLGTIMW